MKKRIFVLIIVSLMDLGMVATAAYAYTLSQPVCHYRAAYGDYVIAWDSRHLNHRYDYWAPYDETNNEYYCTAD
jgi:hypothetical protein